MDKTLFAREQPGSMPSGRGPVVVVGAKREETPDGRRRIRFTFELAGFAPRPDGQKARLDFVTSGRYTGMGCHAAPLLQALNGGTVPNARDVEILTEEDLIGLGCHASVSYQADELGERSPVITGFGVAQPGIILQGELARKAQRIARAAEKRREKLAEAAGA